WFGCGHCGNCSCWLNLQSVDTRAFLARGREGRVLAYLDDRWVLNVGGPVIQECVFYGPPTTIIHTPGLDARVVNPDEIGWIDPEHLFHLVGGRLSLIDLTTSPPSAAPVADHVTLVRVAAPVRRLFYLIRNAGADDGVYWKQL